ncbi:MAG TPA: hypothetical protein PLC04_00055 [Candidatus Kapabacteria bacterium]|nr:hypothetical protein [Candidatus Kapabacteria bacterium]HOV91463.1 hypothetical protein [Candidatus Kapabacteria bacterium]
MQQIIQIDKIEDGMVLAEPVLNQFSQVLLPSGTTLNHFHSSILKKWNINYVFIYIQDNEEELTIPQELIESCKEEILAKLLWSPEQPIEKDLINITAINCAKNKLNEHLENATN